MPKQHRQSIWKELSSRGDMYLVLAACCLAVALSATAGLAIIGRPEKAPAEPQDTQQMVTENDYDRTANAINGEQYSGTILPAGEDAGDAYVRETLFLGDSNTARTYRLFDYCTYENAIGSVGMAARSLANYACVRFEGYSNYLTMPQAVALMQPKRVIITFGTNDLNPNTATDTFITNYETGILAVQEAYPSVDIIVNAIPPLGRQHSGEYLTQSQADAWNLAIVEMCEKNGWKFLNSAEVLKDTATGFARSGYVEGDGIHLTTAAFDAFFNYVRTHSYVTEDDRPPLQGIPRHSDDRDVVDTNALATPTPPPEDEPTATPEASPSATPTQTPLIEDPVTDMPSPTPETTPSPTPEGGTATEAPSPTPEGGTATETPTATPPGEPTETPPSEPTAEPPAEPTATPPGDGNAAEAGTPPA